MIRRLIILLLIVGCVFGDTIRYNQGNNERTIENVKFTRAGNGKVFFKAFGQETSRDCMQVVEFTDADGNQIDYDCNAVIVEESLIELEKKIEDTISEDEVESIIQKIKRPVVGGVFIALGSVVIFGTLGQECDDCDNIAEWEAFSNDISSTQKIGFAFIAVGGFLVALGI